MAVYIACDKCQKRLKIPENVIGHSIKCPACNSVFKADPTKVLPAEQPVHQAALAEEDEVLPARKKAVPVEDEEAVEAKPHKHVVRPVEEDDEPRPARRRRRADYDDEDDDYEDELEETKARTPWYVMLPLLVLSFCAVGVALLWPLGFSWLDMDRTLTLSFEGRMWVGIAGAIVLTLLCLVVSLLSARAWLRFLIVLMLLAIGYGGSFAAARWWKDMGLGKEDKAPVTQPLPGPPGQ
jgi:hypothetical protein